MASNSSGLAEVVDEVNLFRVLVIRLSERDGAHRALVELAGVLREVLSRLVAELTGPNREGALEHVRRCRGTFLQASEAVSLLLECGDESEGRSGCSGRLTRFAEQCESELRQVCHYGAARPEHQKLYRAEVKATLHRLLDTVGRIAQQG